MPLLTMLLPRGTTTNNCQQQSQATMAHALDHDHQRKFISLRYVPYHLINPPHHTNDLENSGINPAPAPAASHCSWGGSRVLATSNHDDAMPPSAFHNGRTTQHLPPALRATARLVGHRCLPPIATARRTRAAMTINGRQTTATID